MSFLASFILSSRSSFSIILPNMESIARRMRRVFSGAHRTPIQTKENDLYTMGRKESDKFRKYLKNMHAVENLVFFERALNYKDLKDEGMRKTMAKSMLQHFEQESIWCINVSDTTKQEILQRIIQGDYKQDLFEKAEKEIVKVLIQPYGIFKNSSS